MIVGTVVRSATNRCLSLRRSCIVALGAIAIGGAMIADGAATEKHLRGMLDDATACSDAVLHDYATRTCDSPETIAAVAVATCKAKWDAVTDQAMGAPSSDVSAKERARSRTIYAAAMENEYIRIAELKAIDMRTDAGRCGFD